MLNANRNYCRCCVFALLAFSLFALPLISSAGQYNPQTETVISKSAKQQLQTKITYSCVEKPIETVLMDLAEQAKIDIVKSPKVTGNVTVKVTDVSLEEVLTNILAAHDYTYIATESMIRVIPVPEMVAAREELVTRIYKITYADADEVAKALNKFVSQQGDVAINKGTGHIMVTDTPDKIKGIDKFIEQIDHITPQVLVEVRLFDVTSKEGFELGAQWHAGRNVPLKTTESTSTRINTDFPTTLTETTTDVRGPSTTTFTEDRTDESDMHDDVVGNYRDSDDAPGAMFERIWGTETREEESTTEDSGRTDIETKETELPLGTFFDTTTERYTTRRRKPFVGASFDRET
ncbi:MAG: secretin N-terminal domain-containing protein [Planctomycetota bacterium]